MKRAFRLVGGTERDDTMAKHLARDSVLTSDGARVIVEVIKKQRANSERFATLVQYLGAEGARSFLRMYDFT